MSRFQVDLVTKLKYILKILLYNEINCHNSTVGMLEI